MAISCDCEILASASMNRTHSLPPISIALYQLEEYGSYKLKNQKECRHSCLKEFEKNMSAEKMRDILRSHSRELINKKLVGYNCTGLTTLKYPVRVKARLGVLGLGHVANFIEVVNLEELCF